MKKLYSKILTGSALVVATPFAFAQDAAIQTAFDAAGTSAATVVGWIALALVTFVAALWVLKAIRSGR